MTITKAKAVAIVEQTNCMQARMYVCMTCKFKNEWMKNTALNLRPMSVCDGSVEVRHDRITRTLDDDTRLPSSVPLLFHTAALPHDVWFLQLSCALGAATLYV